MPLIAPALLSADFARLADALAIIREAGASMIHVDVSDGHFTPDIAVGQPVVASLRRATNLVLEVHLLIERPERFVADFVKAGADRISVHPESTQQLQHAVEAIRTHGAKAGVVLNPATPVESVEEALPDLQFLDVLSADPAGDGGIWAQPFIPRLATKVRAAAQFRDKLRLDFDIEAEGGIGFGHVEGLVQAGADILVPGSDILRSSSPKSQLREMIRLASDTRQMFNV